MRGIPPPNLISSVRATITRKVKQMFTLIFFWLWPWNLKITIVCAWMFLICLKLWIKSTKEKFFKINLKLSRGEICVANFIPPGNGASLGSFLCSKYIESKCCCFGPRPRPCRPLYGQIKNFETCIFAIDVPNFFLAHSVQPVPR